MSLQVLEPLALLLVTVSCACLLFENYFDDVNAPLLMQELLGVFGGKVVVMAFVCGQDRVQRNACAFVV